MKKYKNNKFKNIWTNKFRNKIYFLLKSRNDMKICQNQINKNLIFIFKEKILKYKI